jgi:hypothetical protein
VEPYAGVREQYLRFADEAAEESPCFVAWGLGVAADPEVLAWIDALPGLKKQPNLVFAAARWHGVRAPGPYAGLRSALLVDHVASLSAGSDRRSSDSVGGAIEAAGSMPYHWSALPP